ncbi:hypothetical protein [Asanoa sp. NPDC050611]|uniref:hypothetical protein n=1 Tax=Asanoa sp. NPDC050611 TaxID=3157098 RepID=UPI0033E29ADB
MADVRISSARVVEALRVGGARRFGHARWWRTREVVDACPARCEPLDASAGQPFAS